MQREGNVFGRALGKLNHLKLHAHTLGQSSIRGLRRADSPPGAGPRIRGFRRGTICLLGAGVGNRENSVPL